MFLETFLNFNFVFSYFILIQVSTKSTSFKINSSRNSVLSILGSTSACLFIVQAVMCHKWLWKWNVGGGHCLHTTLSTLTPGAGPLLHNYSRPILCRTLVSTSLLCEARTLSVKACHQPDSEWHGINECYPWSPKMYKMSVVYRERT